MKEGYSFTIITGGHRDDLLERLIQSIHGMKVPAYEIIVTGKYGKRPGIRYNHRPGLAARAEVCKMRNLNCRTARYDKIVILDDDVEFTPDWYEKIKNFTEFDMTGCRGVDPDGNRWFDYNWASRQDPLIPTKTIPYHEYNDSVYISGYFMMFKRHVWAKVKFDESRRNYQFDDVNFCHRVTDAGFKISVFPKATVIHHVDLRGRKVSEEARDEFFEQSAPEEDRLYMRGIKLIRQEKWKQAVKCFKELTALRHGARENYQLGLCYKNIGKISLAEESFRKAARLFPGDKKTDGINLFSVHFHLGEIFEKKGDIKGARREYNKTLKILPKHQKAAQAIERIKGR